MDLKSKIKPNSTALVIVDIQNDYCHEKGSLAKQGMDTMMVEKMMPILTELIEHARRSKVPVIFIKTIHEKSTDSATWTRRLKNTHQAEICRKDTWGAEFFRIQPVEEDIVVTKHRYSAFIHTRLESVLRTLRIKTLIMTGVSTNVCVESTARDGFMLDYDIVLLSDCTAAYSQKAHDMTLENISQYFGVVATSGQVIDTWMRAKEY